MTDCVGTYPATTNREAIDLNINNANRFHEIINGDINTTVPTCEQGGDVPSVQRALHQAAAYRVPIAWSEGDTENDLLQPRILNNFVYVPLTVPAPMVEADLEDDWRLYTISGFFQSAAVEAHDLSAGQTEVPVDFGYVPNTTTLFVYRNGVLLKSVQDYEETDPTKITLVDAGVADDQIMFVKFANQDIGTADASNVSYSSGSVADELTRLEEDKLDKTEGLITVDTLAELPAESDAKFARLALGYPGAGYKSDIQNIERDVVNSRLFGIDANLGLTATQFTDRLQTMIDTAGADDFDVELARGEFDASGLVTIDHTTINSGSDGITIRGAGSRRTQINYSGTGHFLNITGDGDEADNPIKRFSLSDMWIYGNANTDSDGGLLIDRAYFVDLQRMYVTGYAKSDAVAVKVTNTFNFMANMFQFANGFPLPQGQASFQVGSVGPDAWNTSNVVLLNGAIQYGGVNNIEVIHSSGVFDNFVVDNVTLGKSGLNSFKSVNANVNNICLRNNHFESPGYTGDGNPLTAGATHIKIDKANAVRIENNSQQDAYNYIDIDSVGDLTIVDGKYFETGVYTLTGNTLLKIRNTTANVNGTFDANNIRTDQIDNLFDYVESGGRTISINNRWRTNPIESTWSDVIFPSPDVFRGQIINRRASSNAPYDQMYSSDGSSWGRLMYSEYYRGERATDPDGVVSGAAGYFFLSSSGAVFGTGSTQYTVLGWRCTGGTSWVPMRCLTGG